MRTNSAACALRSSYNARLGGHAPGDLRDAFSALDAFQDWEAGTPEPTVKLRDGDPVRISKT
jgi:hypothetical protein